MGTPIDIILQLVADKALMQGLDTIATILRSLEPAGASAAKGLTQVQDKQTKAKASTQEYLKEFNKLNQVLGTTYASVEHAVKAFESQYGVTVKNTKAFKDYARIHIKSNKDIAAAEKKLSKAKEKTRREIERLWKQYDRETKSSLKLTDAQKKLRKAQEKLGASIKRDISNQRNATAENKKYTKAIELQNTALHKAVVALDRQGRSFKDIRAGAYESSEAMQAFTASLVREGPITALRKLRTAGISGRKVFSEYAREMTMFIAASRFGAVMIMTSAIYGMVRAAKAGAEAFIELDSAVRKVMSAQVIDPENLRMGYGDLADEIKRVAVEFNVGFKDAGTILFELKSAGLSVVETMGGFDVVAKLVKTDINDIGTATRLMAGVTQNFGDSFEEAGDIIAYVLNQSLVDVDGLINGLKHASSAAVVTGLDFKTVAAALGVLNDNMMAGGIAGRGFRQILIQIAQETDYLEKELGIVFDKSQKEGPQVASIFLQLSQRFKDGRLNMEEFGSLMEKFGARGGAAVAGVIAQFEKFDRVLSDLNAGLHEGVLDKVVEERMKSMAEQFGRMGEAAKVVGAALASWPVERLADMAETLADITLQMGKINVQAEKWREEAKKSAGDNPLGMMQADIAAFEESFLDFGTVLALGLATISNPVTLTAAALIMFGKSLVFVNDVIKNRSGESSGFFDKAKLAGIENYNHILEQIKFEAEATGLALTDLGAETKAAVMPAVELLEKLEAWEKRVGGVKKHVEDIHQILAGIKFTDDDTGIARLAEFLEKTGFKGAVDLSDYFDPKVPSYFQEQAQKAREEIEKLLTELEKSYVFRIAKEGETLALMKERRDKVKEELADFGLLVEGEKKVTEEVVKKHAVEKVAGKDSEKIKKEIIKLTKEYNQLQKKITSETDKQTKAAENLPKKEQAILEKYNKQKLKSIEKYTKDVLGKYEKLTYGVNLSYSKEYDVLEDSYDDQRELAKDDKEKLLEIEEWYQRERSNLISRWSAAVRLQNGKNAEGIRKDAEKELKDAQKAWEDSNKILLELNKELARDLQDTWSDLFFDFMDGKLKSLSDYFKAFANSVKRSFADMMGSSVSNWMMAGIKNTMGWNMPGTTSSAANPFAQVGQLFGFGGGGSTSTWNGLPSGVQGPPAPGYSGGGYSHQSVPAVSGVTNWIGTNVPGAEQTMGFFGGAGTLAGLGTIYGGYKQAGWKGAAGAGLGYGAGYIGGATLASAVAPAMVSAGLTGAGASLALGLLAPGIGILVGALIGKALSKGAKARAKRQQRHGGIVNDFFSSYGDYFEQAGVGDILTGTRSATDILGNVGYGGYADDNVEKVLASFRAGGGSAYDAFTADFPSRYFKTYGSIYSQIGDQDEALYETFQNILDFVEKFPEYKDSLIDMNKNLEESVEWIWEQETERTQEVIDNYNEEIAVLQEKHTVEMQYYNDLIAMIDQIGVSLLSVQRSRYDADELLAAYYGDIQRFTGDMQTSMGSGDKEGTLANAAAVEQAWMSWYNQAATNIDTLLSTENAIIAATEQMGKGIDADILAVTLSRFSSKELADHYFETIGDLDDQLEDTIKNLELQAIGDLELDFIKSTGQDAIALGQQMIDAWGSYYQSATQDIDQMIQDEEGALEDTLRAFESVISGFTDLREEVSLFGKTPEQIEEDYAAAVDAAMSSLGGLSGDEQVDAAQNLYDTLTEYFDWSKDNLRGDEFYAVKDSIEALFPSIDEILNTGLSSAEIQGQAIIDGLKSSIGILQEDTIAGLEGVAAQLGTVSDLSQEEKDRLNVIFDQVQADTISGLTDLQSILQAESLLVQDKAVYFLEEINGQSAATVAILEDIADRLGGEAFTPAAENIEALNTAIGELTEQIGDLKTDLGNVKIEIGVKEDGLSEYLLEMDEMGVITSSTE